MNDRRNHDDTPSRTITHTLCAVVCLLVHVSVRGCPSVSVCLSVWLCVLCVVGALCRRSRVESPPDMRLWGEDSGVEMMR